MKPAFCIILMLQANHPKENTIEGCLTKLVHRYFLWFCSLQSDLLYDLAMTSESMDLMTTIFKLFDFDQFSKTKTKFPSLKVAEICLKICNGC